MLKSYNYPTLLINCTLSSIMFINIWNNIILNLVIHHFQEKIDRVSTKLKTKTTNVQIWRFSPRFINNAIIIANAQKIGKARTFGKL